MTSRTSPVRRHNGPAIRAFRIKAGMKPGALATKASVAYSTLDNLENERKDASLEVLYRLASALDIPVHAIVRDPAFVQIKAVS